MAPRSPSEGEASEVDKANSTQKFVIRDSVNRKNRDRKSVQSTSNHPPLDGAHNHSRPWSPSPSYSDGSSSKRSNSRSPSRPKYSSSRSPSRLSKSPRGEKRRRQSPDERRVRDRRDEHKSLEHRTSTPGLYGSHHRQKISYADIDHGNFMRDDSRAERQSRGNEGSSKNRRRSPSQQNQLGDRRFDRDSNNRRANEHDNRQRYSKREKLQGNQKTESRVASNDNGRYRQTDSERKGPRKALVASEAIGNEKKRPRATNGRSGEPHDANPDQRVRFASNTAQKFGRDEPLASSLDEMRRGADSTMANTPGSEAITTLGNIDEDSLIEARRKRREAIKAKYQSQTSPVVRGISLQEDGATEKVESSGTDMLRVEPERSVSPAISSPATPLTEGAVESPSAINVDTDMDLANQSRTLDNNADADASAADYDASMDMQEGKARLREIEAVNRTPAKENRSHGLELGERDSGALKNAEKDFDMFAEESDDDMFASSAHDQSALSGAPQVQKAKALDRSLLDDWDDHQGYYKVILREELDGRYHVQSNLGKGVFSAVVRAVDVKTNNLVAIKIIRNNETMRKAGLKEISILEKLKQNDPDDRKHIIRFERSFDHKDHLCMVFENLSINLREVLKKFGRDVGINIKAVRAYAHQMFLGLALLKKSNILHADLKPDNILVNEARNTLKICDLGSAADAEENEITPYLVSRFYRAPEIILGMNYDFGIDMWSVGCTLFELYTGKILFTGRSNNQMLRSIQETRGKLTLKLLKKCEFAGLHFEDDGSFRSMERDVSGKEVVRMLTFSKATEGRDLKSRLLATVNTLDTAEVKEINLFADLLDRCLSLNPEKRITPAQALQHPFIMRTKPKALMTPQVKRPIRGRA